MATKKDNEVLENIKKRGAERVQSLSDNNDWRKLLATLFEGDDGDKGKQFIAIVKIQEAVLAEDSETVSKIFNNSASKMDDFVTEILQMDSAKK